MEPTFPGIEDSYLHLSFRLMRDGSVRLLPSFRLSRSEPPLSHGPQTSVICELRTAEGEVLRSHRCHKADFHSDPEGPYVEYYEILPWASGTAALSFLRDGRELSVVDVEPDSP